jgi:ubiquitin-protein ligase
MGQQSVKPEDIANKYTDQQIKGLYPSKKRILKEIKAFVDKPTSPRIKIFPNEKDMHFWKVLLIGKPGSSYNKGVFMLSVKFPHNFPTAKPNVRFTTNIKHVNIGQ